MKFMILPMPLNIVLLTVILVATNACNRPKTKVSGFTDQQTTQLTIAQISFIDDEGKNLTQSHKMAKKITLKVGKMLVLEDVSRAIQTLRDAFPIFKDISVQLDPDTKNSVKLQFSFQRGRIVKTVNIETTPKVSGFLSLRRKLVTKSGKALQATAVSTDLQSIKETFILKGYADANVGYRIEQSEGLSVDVSYVITTGHKHYVDKVFIKNVKNSDKLFLTQTKLIKQARQGTTLLKGYFRRSDINDLRVKLEAVYFDNGYLDVAITTSYKLKESDLKANRSDVEITFAVNQGTRYTVRKLAIDGHNEVIKESEIRNDLGLAIASPYSEKKLEVGLQNIRENYGEHGYLLAKLDAEFDPFSGQLNIQIISGQKQFVFAVQVDGNDKMSRKTILQDVKIKPGDAINTTAINTMIKKLHKTGYYESVTFDYVPQDSNHGTLIVHVEESSNHFIEFGGGAGSTGGLAGSVGYQNGNLFGKGMRLSVSGTLGFERQHLSVMYNDPHIFGSDYELTTTAGYAQNERENYDISKVTGRIMVNKVIMERLKAGIGTRVEYVNVDDIEERIIGSVADSHRDKTMVYGLVGTLVYNAEKKDRTGVGVSGYKMRVTLMPSYTNEGLYVKSKAEAIGNVTVYKNRKGQSHVLRGRITIGYASSNTPFFEKFRAGGNDTLRGYRYHSVGKDATNAAGKLLLSTGAYYSFPIIYDELRGVTFLESAVAGDKFKDLGNIRLVGGIGARANIKNFMLGTVIEGGLVVQVIKQDESLTPFKPFYFRIGDGDQGYEF